MGYIILAIIYDEKEVFKIVLGGHALDPHSVASWLWCSLSPSHHLAYHFTHMSVGVQPNCFEIVPWLTFGQTNEFLDEFDFQWMTRNKVV